MFGLRLHSIIIHMFRGVSRAYQGETKEYTVKKINGTLICECGESVYQGYPCRHEMALCVCLLKDTNVLSFQSRWRKDFFYFQNESYQEREREEMKEEEGKEGLAEEKNEEVPVPYFLSFLDLVNKFLILNPIPVKSKGAPKANVKNKGNKAPKLNEKNKKNNVKFFL